VKRIKFNDGSNFARKSLDSPNMFIKPISSKAKYVLRRCFKFLRANWIGTVVILLATLIFLWPIVTRIDTYSPGGDAMFNAWTLARDQHCILRENCPNYANGNIFYPNKSSMLYSETQLSAGLITLPLYFINENPIFSYNVWTIVSFFLAGWFMYLLAKYLSRGDEFFSILSGLAFAFAPIKIVEITHLQNLSIFYLPLIVLLIIKYLKQPRRKYLVGLFVTLTLMFYASWYQMVFAIVAVLILLFAVWFLKIAKWRPMVPVLVTLLLAIIVTLPLAREYAQFSKTSGASYGVSAQNTYSSSVEDYLIPYSGTYLGDMYYKVHPQARVNSFSPDGDSYSGFTLYAVAAILLVVSFLKRKKNKDWSYIYKWTMVFVSIAVVGFIISLGPFLKVGSSYLHNVPGTTGIRYAIALPYLVVDKLAPQLDFIRAIDRASVLVLFGLCCALALVPIALTAAQSKKILRYCLSALLLILLAIEFFPTHGLAMSSNPYYYNMNIPPVYKYIHNNPAVNDIIVLAPDNNYPGQTYLPAPFLNGVFEQVLWAGYDNKNTFNGYSGYFPPNYNSEINQFDNFQASDLPEMKALGLRYILVDKLLSSSEPSLVNNISHAGLVRVYQDKRYVLFKI
jgi:hypothetical protein